MINSRVEPRPELVLGFDFKSNGGLGIESSAGSIPVRFRHTSGYNRKHGTGRISMSFRIHFHDDVPHSHRIREECERHSDELQKEFPEMYKCEVAISHSGDEHETHVHVRGKDVDVASHAKNREMQNSVIEAFDKTRKQLRKHHDKVIFAKRREH